MDKNFGSLAGFGGYPTRNAMPNSKPVANMDAWNDDWNARREQAIWEARAAASPDQPSEPQRIDGGGTFSTSRVVGPDGVRREMAHGTSGGPVSYGGQQIDGGHNVVTSTVIGPDGQPRQMASGVPISSSQSMVPLSSLDLSELYKTFDDERTNAFAPTIRNQQAYDSMRGWGQENGVMGANYIQPGHGQINGQAPASPLDQLLGQSGIDPSWATGTYDPYSPNSGTFGGARGGYDWAF